MIVIKTGEFLIGSIIGIIALSTALLLPITLSVTATWLIIFGGHAVNLWACFCMLGLTRNEKVYANLYHKGISKRIYGTIRTGVLITLIGIILLNLHLYILPSALMMAGFLLMGIGLTLDIFTIKWWFMTKEIK